MTTEELKQRTKSFAVRVTRLVDALPNTVKGRAIANQIMRSATSIGANYRAACRARSRAEFIAKIGVVEEEADESGFWLEMLRDILELRSAIDERRTAASGSRREIRHSKLDLRTSTELARLLDESDQLVAITVSSRKTAKGNNG